MVVGHSSFFDIDLNILLFFEYGSTLMFSCILYAQYSNLICVVYLFCYPCCMIRILGYYAEHGLYLVNLI